MSRTAASATLAWAAERNGVEHRLGDERERPLRADHQPPEDLQRLVGVEERAQAVAHRVLDLELAARPARPAPRRRAARRGSRPGPARARARRRRTARRRRARPCRSRSRRSAPASSTAPCGRSPRSTPQRIPPELLAITPPTQAMSVEAGSGPSLRPCLASSRLTWPSTIPGLDADGAAVLEHLGALPVTADVDEHRVGLGLAVERGAAGTERDRHRALARERQQPGHVGDVVGHRHRLGDQAVRARVRGVADQVQRAGQHLVGAERLDELRAQRLGRPGRNPVRRPVGRRLGGRGRRDCRERYSSHIPGATCACTSLGPSWTAIAPRSASVSSSRPSASTDGTP